MITALLATLLAAQTFPPALPGGKEAVTDTSDEFLKPGSTLKGGVAIAKAAPTVDFLFFPCQTYAGNPWSTWGDSVVAGGKYYASLGDHLSADSKKAAQGTGTGYVYEYDPATKKLRLLADASKVLNLPKGHYTPGKIHGRLDMGEDGWLYYSTHRGSTRVTIDQYHYKGDWIFRTNPATAETEVLVCGPVPKHCIPASVLDPKRMIFYGGTAAGSGDGSGEDDKVQFFAYDVKAKKVLYSGPDGPGRYMILARSTGRIYWVPGKDDRVGPVVRWDPEKGGAPAKIDAVLGCRAATQETADGMVYTVSKGGRGGATTIYAFNTKTEKAEALGDAAVGSQAYIASIDVDPSGRYLYYCAGAHGGSDGDGTPIVQFDVRTKQRKVIAFLAPFYRKAYGFAPVGTYSTAIDEKGETLYVTWNVNRSGRAWDCVGMTAIHIPPSERP
jgi:hypothetical protein